MKVTPRATLVAVFVALLSFDANGAPSNGNQSDASLDQPLRAELVQILKDDQDLRLQALSAQKTYGYNSKQVQDLWMQIGKKDRANLVKVGAIIAKYGWVGPDQVGPRASQAIFLVIQHADLQTQEKYLPIMREAVKNRKAQPSALALLEDRVAMREGRLQIYGSQIHRDNASGKFYISPLEDPDHVDQRRASMGLQPLADYVKRWGIVWDPSEYKRELPQIEKRENRGTP